MNLVVGRLTGSLERLELALVDGQWTIDVAMALNLIAISRSGLRGLVIGAVAGVEYGALVTGMYGVWLNFARPQLLPAGATLPMIVLGMVWGTPTGAVLGTVVGAVVAAVGQRQAWVAASVAMGLALLAWLAVFQANALQVLTDAPFLFGAWLVFSVFVGLVVSRTPRPALTTSTLGIGRNGPAPN